MVETMAVDPSATAETVVVRGVFVVVILVVGY